jgi:DNA-binding NarL/FixJ family response regulator
MQLPSTPDHLNRSGLIRLVVVEDHVALRTALEMLLGRHGCVVIGSAATAAEADALMARVTPDVAIIDVHLPDESGIAMAKRLLERDPELGILLYTGADDRETLQAALNSGARGLALKEGAHQELAEAVRTIARGGTHLDPRLAARLVTPPARAHAAGGPSRREREVLQLLADGLTGEQIAERLVLSATTVQTHVRNAMQKLGAHTRVRAITLALAHGYITLREAAPREPVGARR